LNATYQNYVTVQFSSCNTAYRDRLPSVALCCAIYNIVVFAMTKMLFGAVLLGCEIQSLSRLVTDDLIIGMYKFNKYEINE